MQLIVEVIKYNVVSCFEYCLKAFVQSSSRITGAKGIGKATFAWRIAKFLLTQPIAGSEPNGSFGNSGENQNSELDENRKKAIVARILAESEPRLSVIRKSFDEKRKTFRSSIRVDEIRPVSYTHLTLPTIYSV